MLRYSSRESTVERFIGWLTIALGIGAFIPRPGLGLYALLQESGARQSIGGLMIVVGIGAILCTYLLSHKCRFVSLTLVMLLWGYLGTRFIDASLWGALMQTVVVIYFTNTILWNLIRDNQNGKENN